VIPGGGGSNGKPLPVPVPIAGLALAVVPGAESSGGGRTPDTHQEWNNRKVEWPHVDALRCSVSGLSPRCAGGFPAQMTFWKKCIVSITAERVRV
jgi:hypothetical protein